MREVKISASGAWQRQHWRSLHSAYNRSPFFAHYAGELEKLYEHKAGWLFDWNRTCLEWVKEKTGWPPGLLFLSEPSAGRRPGTGPGDALPGDLRAGPMPKNYLDFPAPVYTQVFEERRGFQANLSVLDLLFNAGPQSHEILARGGNRETPHKERG